MDQGRASDKEDQAVEEVREESAVANSGNIEELAAVFRLSQLTHEKDDCRYNQQADGDSHDGRVDVAIAGSRVDEFTVG